ncbi:MAG: porin family protein [Bacteroidota bacterium]
MKKIVVLLAFFTCLASIAVAQEEKEIRFGFHLSPTFNWMSANTNDINPSGTNLGLRLGMIGEYYFRENYAITTGIGFIFNHGGTLQHENSGRYWTRTDLPIPDGTDMPDGVSLDYGIQYLEIPLGLKMRTREFGYIRYYAEPSVILGIKTQARGKVEQFSQIDSEEQFNIRDEVNLLNMSWGIGGGVEYSISENTRLIGGLALHFGFLDVTDDNGQVNDPDRPDPVEEDSKGITRSLTIRIGIMF